MVYLGTVREIFFFFHIFYYIILLSVQFENEDKDNSYHDRLLENKFE